MLQIGILALSAKVLVLSVVIPVAIEHLVWFYLGANLRNFE